MKLLVCLMSRERLLIPSFARSSGRVLLWRDTISDSLASIILPQEGIISHFCLVPTEPDHFLCPIFRSVDWDILAEMIDVLHGVLDLKVVRQSHQMQQLPYIEEPVLNGMDGKVDVLTDHSVKIFIHENKRFVPIAEILAPLVLDVFQALYVRLLSFQGEGLLWKVVG